MVTRFVHDPPRGFVQGEPDLRDFTLNPLITGPKWYVDPRNGNDGNSGQAFDDAYATMQTGIDSCTDELGDFIIRMRGYEAITTPLLFNKKGISIIAGVFGNNDRQAEDFATHNTGTTGPCVILSQRCHLYGLTFASNNVTTPGDGRANNAGTNSAAAMYFLGDGGGIAGTGFNGGFSTIESCRFPDWIAGAVWGIEFGAGASNLITNCKFEGLTAGIVFGGTAYNNPIDTTIEYNWFNDLTDGVRMLPGTAQDIKIHGNHFMDVSGYNVNENSNGGNGQITGNWSEKSAATSYNLSIDNMIVAGWNPAGNYYIEAT